MTGAGRRAFGYARVRALHSRLLTPAQVAAFARAPARRPVGEAVAAWPSPRQAFAALVACYRKMLAAYEDGGPLFLALLRRHELENLKLAWRGALRGREVARVRGLWRDLGPLAALAPPPARETLGTGAVVAATRRTPYEAVASALHRAHGSDLAAIELGLDRWASTAIVAAAAALGPRDAGAADLARGIVRERDLRLLERGVRTYGLPPEAVAAGTALLAAEEGVPALAAVAGWTPADPRPLAVVLPRGLARAAAGARDWPALHLALGLARRRACRRALAAAPFTLAPPCALLVLQEEQYRLVWTLTEARTIGTRAADSVRQVVAAHAVGG